MLACDLLRGLYDTPRMEPLGKCQGGEKLVFMRYRVKNRNYRKFGGVAQ